MQAKSIIFHAPIITTTTTGSMFEIFKIKNSQPFSSLYPQSSYFNSNLCYACLQSFHVNYVTMLRVWMILYQKAYELAKAKLGYVLRAVP